MYQAKLSEKLDNISSYPRVSRQCFGLLEVSWSDVEELEQLCEKNPLQSFFLHVVPTSWLNYLRRQFVYNFFYTYIVLSFVCIFIIYTLSIIYSFVFVPLNLSKLFFYILSCPSFHFLYNSTIQPYWLSQFLKNG